MRHPTREANPARKTKTPSKKIIISIPSPDSLFSFGPLFWRESGQKRKKNKPEEGLRQPKALRILSWSRRTYFGALPPRNDQYPRHSLLPLWGRQSNWDDIPKWRQTPLSC